jgi:hypothetical protein
MAANGRPTHLTDETEAKILTFIRTGVPLEVAAQAAGVTPRVFWDWMASGEGRPAKITPSERVIRFSQRVREVEAETHALVIGTIRTAAVTNGDWRAAYAYARMRWSKYYADRTEISGPGGEPLIVAQDHERVLLRKAIDEYLSTHPDEAEVPVETS